MRHTTLGRALLAAALLTAAGCRQAEAKPPELNHLAPDALRARQQHDIRLLQAYRHGLSAVVAYVNASPALFPPATPKELQVPSERQREAVRDAWKSLLDYYAAMDSIGRYHQEFYQILSREARETSLVIVYAGLAARYRCALEFIQRAEASPAVVKILNDAMTDAGLPEGTYARFKLRFLNTARGLEFAALSALYKATRDGVAAELRPGIAEDAAYLWRMGRGRGELLTAKNALEVVRRAGFAAWFPVQAGVSEWMGDTKVWRKEVSLVSEEQIRELTPKLLPGDILLERREWFLSNIGLPGFWPHAALYVGTPVERRAFFNDEAVNAWVKQMGRADGDFESLLADRCPQAYAKAIAPQEHGHAPRVLEAMSEGVVFTTIEHSAACDTLCVLRPRLSRQERAVALLRALCYHGRPYDFNFDFVTDSALVCSELTYKAYEPEKGYRGLRLPVTEMLGRAVVTPNGMVRQFDEDFGGERQQFDLVLFLDGREKDRKAVPGSLQEFRASWRRPKWHALAQKDEDAR